MTRQTGRIESIAGPVVKCSGIPAVRMYEVVRVGHQKLIGEVIEVGEEEFTAQVYEETSGVAPGEPVEATGDSLSVELGPGLLGSIYDGIQRPLPDLREMSGDFITRGLSVEGLNKEKKWEFNPTVKVGDNVEPGDIIGEVPETGIITSRILIPFGVKGEIVEIVKKGEYTVNETICKVKDQHGDVHNVMMMQRTPVRVGRSFKERVGMDTPLVTGQRVIDTFMPQAKGGTGAIPGGFGTGKTVALHQFAKWADAQVVVYVGCGERGNEMTEALEEWPHLKDPKTGRPLMERTVLIANTSNMPVAAREASIYVAVTLAEYFRDQGFDVALMADSTSRWAEALREISGRLGQLPSEEGYPAYLGSRLAQFYERGGRVKTLGSKETLGSITICGAVSPPGGDFSEPVTQATLRIVKVFWALDKDLAARRFFPAINTLTSYSLYFGTLEKWQRMNMGNDWPELVKEALALLQKDQELREIVQLVGPDALPESERAVLEAARMIKEDFLTQSALHEIDTFSPMGKTYRMLRIIINFTKKMTEAVQLGVHVRRILELSVLDNIARMKIAPWDSYDETMDAIERKMEGEFQSLFQEMSESGLLYQESAK
ncbi:MAG: ATP synthase subunit A [Candidatus Thorarchaeota archaeon SMTZ-45]|nr:MAG: ATP synthase subunit A [Candidatus Thorarchaeota archaeon SMTZ1-45]KXH76022.1 MAG: ATP synthase subunit A [Candidatus Thorarchaeota archaeon SMTZ-45]